jgi:hypothetical protein
VIVWSNRASRWVHGRTTFTEEIETGWEETRSRHPETRANVSTHDIEALNLLYLLCFLPLIYFLYRLLFQQWYDLKHKVKVS